MGFAGIPRLCNASKVGPARRTGYESNMGEDFKQPTCRTRQRSPNHLMCVLCTRNGQGKKHSACYISCESGRPNNDYHLNAFVCGCAHRARITLLPHSAGNFPKLFTQKSDAPTAINATANSTLCRIYAMCSAWSIMRRVLQKMWENTYHIPAKLRKFQQHEFSL